MDFKGFKIDFLGLAAFVTALGALYSKIKSHSKKKEKDNDPKNTSEN